MDRIWSAQLAPGHPLLNESLRQWARVERLDGRPETAAELEARVGPEAPPGALQDPE